MLVISTPMKRFFSHLPACVEASACGICRASASMSVIACSAVVIELPNGVFITMMPLAVAAGMSTLSTPMPARPITFRLFAFSKILGVTLVAERMARPSKSPTSSASLSLSPPSFGWKSTSMPRSLKICTAAGESASEMRTLGGMIKNLSTRHAVSVLVMRGLDPRIHLLARKMDCRVKPGNDGSRYAALRSASLLLAKAQSSQSVSASTSARSTVEPHQMRKPGGASR